MNVDRCAHCHDQIIPTITGWTHADGNDDCPGHNGFDACDNDLCRDVVAEMSLGAHRRRPPT
jgi:hypothetical protein